MTEKRIFTKFLSIISAAAISCSWAAGSTVPAARAESPEIVDWENDEMLPVIVRVRGDAVLASDEAAEEGADLIDTEEGGKLAEKILSNQEKAEEYIRSIYPELDIEYRYKLVYNGFSCTLPESVVKAAMESPYIEDIVQDRSHYSVQPQMTNAPELAGYDPLDQYEYCTGEGEVIAVIDSEMNVYHSMFMPIDGLDNKISKADVESLASAKALSVDFDPDKAYLSSKIPFAYDYIDDTPYDLADQEIYHGTHICGIAAGNRTKTPEGEDISGMAPDAQLIMMKVFNKFTDHKGEVSSYCNESVVAAAMEDAAALKADVINLSLGGPGEDLENSPYNAAISSLRNAGIMVCVSAGNDGMNYEGSGEKPNLTRNVDTGTVGTPANYPDAFSVASAENNYMIADSLVINGNEIRYLDCSKGKALTDLPGNTYSWEYVGKGTAEEIAKADLRGKIAVCDRGEILLKDKADNARNAGAVGIIICNNSYKMEVNLECSNDFPAVLISQQDGMTVRANAGSPVSFLEGTHGKTERLSSISTFSSVGVSSSLNLAPMITGIGGGVVSADYNDSFSSLSGTSMASPYVAGCCAIMDEYLKKQGIIRSGAEKVDLIKNILMNTASHYYSDMNMESPRRQGAGCVSLEAAKYDNVVVTGKRGIAAIELGDKLGDQVSFDVDITNFSDTDVTFPGISLNLTTDGCYFDEELGEYCIADPVYLLTSAENYPSSVTVKAGQTSSIHFEVTIDSEFSKRQAEVFPNGYFVEGYISFFDSTNNPDISVPVLGFSDDWAAVPIFDDGYYHREISYTAIGDGYFDIHQSLAESILAMKGFLKDNGLVQNNDFYLGIARDKFTPEMEKAMAEAMESPEDITPCVSVNGDHIADYVDLEYMLNREAMVTARILNLDGESLVEYDSYVPSNSFEECTMSFEPLMTGLEDGTYKLCLDAYIAYPGAEETPQRYVTDLIVDNTEPELTTDLTEENGRKILTVTVKDSNPDGLYFIASDGQYMNYDEENLLNVKAMKSAFTLVRRYTSDRLQKAGNQDSLVMKELLEDPTGMEYNNDIVKIIPLSGEGGTYTFDVTDLVHYEVTAIDRAYNHTTKNVILDLPDSISDYMWWAKSDSTDRYITHSSEDGSAMIMQQSDGSTENIGLEYTSDTITITHADGSSESAEYSWLDRTTLSVKWSDGNTEEWSMNGYNPGMKFYYTTEELSDMAMKYFEDVNGYRPDGIECSRGYGAFIDMKPYVINNNGDKVEVDYYRISRFSGTGENNGNDLSLSDYSKMEPGAWTRVDDPGDDLTVSYMIFDENENGKRVFQEDGRELTFTTEHNGPSITFTYSDGTVENYELRSGGFIGDIELLGEGMENSITMQLYPFKEEPPVYTNTELEELAKNYYEHRYGIRPADAKVVNTDWDIANIYLYDENGVQLEKYNTFISNTFATDLSGRAMFLNDPDNPLFMPGDLDRDGIIDATDASRVLVIYAANQTGEPLDLEPEENGAADVNDDGTIDANDASMILAYYSYTQTGGKNDIYDFVESQR